MGIKSEVEKNNYLDADGGFFAKLTKVEEMSGKFKDPALRFTFEILEDPEHAGKLVTGLTGKKVTPDNKTSKWVAALDPSMDLSIGTIIDFESLEGNICRVNVVQNDDGDRAYYNVVQIRALKPNEFSRFEKKKEQPKKEELKVEEKKPEKKEEKKKPLADDDVDF